MSETMAEQGVGGCCCGVGASGRRGAELQRAARAQLSADAAAQIEQQARVQPLAEVLAELALPGVHR